MRYILFIRIGLLIFIPILLIISTIFFSYIRYRKINIIKTKIRDSSSPKVLLKKQKIIEPTVTLYQKNLDDGTRTVHNNEEDFTRTPEIGEILKDKYRVDKILGSGAQGSVFVCTNIELGNTWAVKHFSGSMNEKDILVKLNHTCLPKISDLFYDDKGSYIVESYVEGRALDRVLDEFGPVDEDTVIDWMSQLCDALSYIHSKDILHMDIKPPNIIITDDGQAILIDFGIASHGNSMIPKSYDVYGYTPNYCPPEQRENSGVDRRSDIYSLGATALSILTGAENAEINDLLLISDISEPLADLIKNCLEPDKENRYADALTLKAALENITRIKRNKEKAKSRNRYLFAAIIPLILVSGFLLYTGNKEYQDELLSEIQVNIEHIILSEQELKEIEVKRVYQNGLEELLPAELITWDVSDQDVATVENGIILGKNPGDTIISGQYLNKTFAVDVIVDSGVLGVDISLKYNLAYQTEIYSGTGTRDIVDGARLDASYLSPISIAKGNGDLIYVADRYLRKIDGDSVTTIDTGIYQPSVLGTSSSGRIFFSSKEWQNEDNQYVTGLFQVNDDDSIEEVVSFNVVTSEVSDFSFDSDDNIYMILTDYIYQKSNILMINNDFSDYSILYESEELFAGMTIDSADRIYLSQPDTAVIYRLDKENGSLEFFAGSKYEKDFVDGRVMRLFEPYALATDGKNIYVIDHHIIRKIIVENGTAVESETISGAIELAEETVIEGKSYETSYLGGVSNDLCFSENSLLVCDEKSKIIRTVYYGGER